MKLREKVIVGIAIFTVVFVLTVSFHSQILVVHTFNKLEEVFCRQNLARAKAALVERVADLDAMAKDWATWDDTYFFVQDRNPDFIKDNLTVQALTTIRCDILALFDKTGQVVVQMAVDRSAGKAVDDSAALMDQLTNRAVQVPLAITERGVSGLLVADDMHFMVAARPIFNSMGNGPARGVLVMARSLGDGEIRRLSRTIQAETRLHTLRDSHINADLLKLVLDNPDLTIVKSVRAATIEAFGVLPDVYGRLDVIVETRMAREISAVGRQTGRVFLVVLVLAAGTLALLGGWLLGRHVLRRLSALDESVAAIATSGDLGSRVAVEGGDEIAAVAGSMNAMLDRLERSQADLKESEARYRRLVESLRREYFLYSLGPDGVFRYVSPSIRDVLGYTQNEFLTHYTIHLTDHPANVQARKSTDLNMQGQTQPLHEMEVYHKDGTRRWIETIGTPIRDASGRVVDVEGIAHDVTAIRRSKDERDALEGELRQKQKQELTGNLARGVVQEISEPTSGILSQAGLLLESLPAGDARRAIVGGILRDGDRVGRMIKALLTFSSREDSLLQVARMADITSTVTSLIGPTLRGDEIALLVDVGDDLPEIACRAAQIQQVLMALLSNARESLNERYVGTHADKRIRVISFVMKEEGNAFLRTTVEDHGLGISDTARARIFEPFFTTKSRSEHSGLGLALSHSIIRQHGGRIGFETEDRHYARFHIDLPLAAADGNRSRT
jgi:PAS domain S-box-containing protein